MAEGQGGLTDPQVDALRAIEHARAEGHRVGLEQGRRESAGDHLAAVVLNMQADHLEHARGRLTGFPKAVGALNECIAILRDGASIVEPAPSASAQPDPPGDRGPTAEEQMAEARDEDAADAAAREAETSGSKLVAVDAKGTVRRAKGKRGGA